ncbi:hypothetical protein, partial [Nocardia sp. NPDC004260]
RGRIDEVVSLDADRILRAILGLVKGHPRAQRDAPPTTLAETNRKLVGLSTEKNAVVERRCRIVY